MQNKIFFVKMPGTVRKRFHDTMRHLISRATIGLMAFGSEHANMKKLTLYSLSFDKVTKIHDKIVQKDNDRRNSKRNSSASILHFLKKDARRTFLAPLKPSDARVGHEKRADFGEWKSLPLLWPAPLIIRARSFNYRDGANESCDDGIAMHFHACSGQPQLTDGSLIVTLSDRTRPLSLLIIFFSFFPHFFLLRVPTE